MNKVLVVLSGGQDSTTCLYWALNRFHVDNVETITFDYGQRHRIELECAQKIVELVKVPSLILPINSFSVLGGTALTDEINVQSDLNSDTQLPNTFVPGRNLIFLTFAAAYAYQRKIKNLVTGVAQTDYSGYPDCRENTIKSLENTIYLGMECDIKIHAPLMFKSKKETVEMARELGAIDAMAYTHTCYNGTRPPCGECPACKLRSKGFAEAGIDDPLLKDSVPSHEIALIHGE